MYFSCRIYGGAVVADGGDACGRGRETRKPGSRRTARLFRPSTRRPCARSMIEHRTRSIGPKVFFDRIRRKETDAKTRDTSDSNAARCRCICVHVSAIGTIYLGVSSTPLNGRYVADTFVSEPCASRNPWRNRVRTTVKIIRECIDLDLNPKRKSMNSPVPYLFGNCRQRSRV